MTTPRSAWWLSFVCVFACLLASARAEAHAVGVSRGEYEVQGTKVLAAISLARDETPRAIPDLADEGGRASLARIEARKEALARWLIDRLDVRADDGSCTGTFEDLRFEGDGVTVALVYACERVVSALQVNARFVADLTPGHRHLATLSGGATSVEWVADASEPMMTWSAPRPEAPVPLASPPATFGPLLRMGVVHILTGYDHLLFLLGLVLVGGSLRALVGAITAFTVAHSITLGAASLGLWAPSPRIVEPAIALSIAYVGIENWFLVSPKGRWRLTFPFGLLHGFGFASALRAIALPRMEVPASLFAFNVGVEAGQLLVLGAMVPVVYAFGKSAWWRATGWRVCSAMVAASGVVWFGARVIAGHAGRQ